MVLLEIEQHGFAFSLGIPAVFAALLSAGDHILAKDPFSALHIKYKIILFPNGELQQHL